MEINELKRMRRKQILTTNGLLLSVIMIYFLITHTIDLTLSGLYLTLGSVGLVVGLFGLLKGEKTKSWIPIFEEVAAYEQQKMGKEWKKQRKMGYIWNLIISALMFMQFFLYRDSSDIMFSLDITFMAIITILLVVLINISLQMHIKKVDRSTSAQELKGYTWKSNLIGIVIGIIIGFVVIFITIFYIISTI